MVGCVCLILFCFLRHQKKKIFGLKTCLILATIVFGKSWKHLELSVLENFHPDWIVLFRSDAPDCVLNTLSNCQLIESIKLVYLQEQN